MRTQIDPKYRALPDEFLSCLVARRHAIPLSQSKRQKVRLSYDGGASVLVVETIGACIECGTIRRQVKYATSGREHTQPTYEYPEGYRCAPGDPWEYGKLWAEFERRHKTGRPLVRKVAGPARFEHAE